MAAMTLILRSMKKHIAERNLESMSPELAFPLQTLAPSALDRFAGCTGVNYDWAPFPQEIGRAGQCGW
jgi:hypothetical protein